MPETAFFMADTLPALSDESSGRIAPSLQTNAQGMQSNTTIIIRGITSGA